MADIGSGAVDSIIHEEITLLVRAALDELPPGPADGRCPPFVARWMSAAALAWGLVIGSSMGLSIHTSPQEPPLVTEPGQG